MFLAVEIHRPNSDFLNMLKMFGKEVFHIYELFEFTLFGISFNLLQILLWGFIVSFLVYLLRKWGE